MNIYITNLKLIKRNNPDFIYIHDLFDWRVIPTKEGFEVKKELKDRFRAYGNNISAFVSPSRYKLMFDVLSFSNNSIIYNPYDFINNNTYKQVEIDKKTLFKDMENFIKRSYISYLNGMELKKVGMQRIEQYILIGFFKLISNKIQNNIFKNNSNEKTIKEEIVTIKDSLDFLNFVYAVWKLEKNKSFYKIIIDILSLHHKGIITDPYIGNFSFIIANSKSYLYKHYNNIINNKIKLNYIKTPNGIIKKATTSLIIKYYLNLEENINIFKLLEKQLKDILPPVDIYTNLVLSLRHKKILEIDNNFMVEQALKLDLKGNRDWLIKDTWKQIYDREDYSFGKMANPIQFGTMSFKCPSCSSRKFKSTPLSFYCTKRNCNFIFDRVNLSRYHLSRISEYEMLASLNSKTLMKLDNNGNWRLLYLNQNKDYYQLYTTDKSKFASFNANPSRVEL